MLRNKLEKHLTTEQIEAYLKYKGTFLTYLRDKTPENLSKNREAYARFLDTTNGKDPCEVIPISVW